MKSCRTGSGSCCACRTRTSSCCAADSRTHAQAQGRLEEAQTQLSAAQTQLHTMTLAQTQAQEQLVTIQSQLQTKTLAHVQAQQTLATTQTQLSTSQSQLHTKTLAHTQAQENLTATQTQLSTSQSQLQTKTLAHIQAQQTLVQTQKDLADSEILRRANVETSRAMIIIAGSLVSASPADEGQYIGSILYTITSLATNFTSIEVYTSDGKSPYIGDGWSGITKFTDKISFHKNDLSVIGFGIMGIANNNMVPKPCLVYMNGFAGSGANGSPELILYDEQQTELRISSLWIDEKISDGNYTIQERESAIWILDVPSSAPSFAGALNNQNISFIGHTQETLDNFAPIIMKYLLLSLYNQSLESTTGPKCPARQTDDCIKTTLNDVLAKIFLKLGATSGTSLQYFPQGYPVSSIHKITLQQVTDTRNVTFSDTTKSYHANDVLHALQRRFPSRSVLHADVRGSDVHDVVYVITSDRGASRLGITRDGTGQIVLSNIAAADPCAQIAPSMPLVNFSPNGRKVAMVVVGANFRLIPLTGFGTYLDTINLLIMRGFYVVVSAVNAQRQMIGSKYPESTFMIDTNPTTIRQLFTLTDISLFIIQSHGESTGCVLSFPDTLLAPGQWCPGADINQQCGSTLYPSCLVEMMQGSPNFTTHPPLVFMDTCESAQDTGPGTWFDAFSAGNVPWVGSSTPVSESLGDLFFNLLCFMCNSGNSSWDPMDSLTPSNVQELAQDFMQFQETVCWRGGADSSGDRRTYNNLKYYPRT